MARFLAPRHFVSGASGIVDRSPAELPSDDVAAIPRWSGADQLTIGVDGIVAAWTHPLGISFGLAQKKPLVRNDEVVAAMAFTFVLNFDRRVMAGAQAARFFARICGLLRDPRELAA